MLLMHGGDQKRPGCAWRKMRLGRMRIEVLKRPPVRRLGVRRAWQAMKVGHLRGAA